MTNEDCDTVSFAGMTKLLVLCSYAKVSRLKQPGNYDYTAPPSGLQKRASRKQQKDDVYSRARTGYCFECYPVYQQHRLPFSVA